MFQVQARAQCDKNVTCPSLVLCIYEALWDPAWQKLLYWMGQIAACLTDLICLIEQRDAFGFTSPSKAADSASVKKRGRGEKGKGKEKHPRDISTATGDHLHTLERLPGALFISFKTSYSLLQRAGAFRSLAANNGCELGKSVNCRRHWSGAELGRWLESTDASCWDLFGPDNTADPIFPQNPEHASLNAHTFIRSRFCQLIMATWLSTPPLFSAAACEHKDEPGYHCAWSEFYLELHMLLQPALKGWC